MIRLCAFADEAGKPLDEQIAAMKKNGISLLEMRSVDGKNVSDLTVSEATAYYEKLKENGISVWSVGSPLGKTELPMDDAYLQKVENTCRVANAVKADKIRMFSFFKAYDKKEDVMAGLKTIASYGKKYGVKMCHENEKEIYGDTVARVEEIMAEKIDGLSFVFDPANYIQCGEETDKALDKLFDKTTYFHIKDVIAETGELVPAGYGDGHIDYMLDKIAESGKDFVLTLEPHLRVFAGYGAIDNTEMKNKFSYATNAESFDAAADGLKAVLKKCGYKEIALEDGTKGWVK